MRPAEVMSLIDANPENPKGRRASDVIGNQVLKTVFKLCLTGFNRLIFAGFAARQSVKEFSGVKEDAQADALPEAIAETQISDDDRNFMAQLVADASQEPAL
jgi:hypothetical protein